MSSAPRVLLAEDNPRLRRLLGITLSQRFTVDVVADGAALEQYLCLSDYDLVVTDLQLPKQPALSALRRFERQCELGHRKPCPVLLISALDPSDEVVCCARRQRYVRGLLHKPFDLRVFTTKVAELLGQHDISPANQTCMANAVRNVPRVLIFQDRYEAAVSLSGTLESAGCVTRVCGSIDEMIDCCNAARFDLLVLDMVLHGSPVTNVLFQLQSSVEQGRLPSVRVLGRYGVLPTESLHRFPSIEFHDGSSDVPALVESLAQLLHV